VLADYEGPLEPLGTLAEAERWLEELAAEGRIGADSAARLRDDAAEARRPIEARGLPMQAVHGDAHLDNAINTASRHAVVAATRPGVIGDVAGLGQHPREADRDGDAHDRLEHH
jgi:aminoglycoside phosphotransferase (APT) family kinase protein